MILVLLAAAAAPAGGIRVPPSLSAAMAAYDGAQVKGNAAALLRLLAPDYLLVNSGGAIEDRGQFVADLTAAGYRLNPYVVLQPVLRVWSGGAVAGGVARLTGMDGGQPFDACLRFADVWRLRGGRWQVVFTQASRADPKACSAT